MRARFDKLLLNNGSGLLAEYNAARTKSESDPAYFSRLTPLTPTVRHRNRYRDVLTLENTRVRLQEREDASDYINANHVCYLPSLPTIVCQAPLEHTAEHFWQMCWEQQVPLIVMLTGFVEPSGHGGMREKSHQYFPLAQATRARFGAYTVSVVDTKSMAPGWSLRKLELTRAGHESRILEHIHCTSWPDFGKLEQDELEGLQRALAHLKQTREAEKSSAVVVHCSAGIGRSGTFVALETLLAIMQAAESDATTVVEEDLPFKIVVELRNQRPGMVQTADQYGMIYQVALALSSPQAE